MIKTKKGTSTIDLNSFNLLMQDIKRHPLNEERNSKLLLNIFSIRQELYSEIEALENYTDLMNENQQYKWTGNLYSKKGINGFNNESIRTLALQYEKAKDPYITSNLGIIIKQLTMQDKEAMLDKFQDAAIYFQKAFNTYEINEETGFLTYAYNCTGFGIVNSFKKDDLITQRDEIRYAKNRIIELKTKLDREPTLHEAITAFPHIRKEHMQYAYMYSQQILSLDFTMPDSKQPMVETIENELDVSLEEQMDIELLQRSIKNIIQDETAFTIRDRKILTMRFGIGLPDEYSLEVVGQQFCITRERVRQLESKALTLLKNKYKNKLYKFY